MSSFLFLDFIDENKQNICKLLSSLERGAIVISVMVSEAKKRNSLLHDAFLFFVACAFNPAIHHVLAVIHSLKKSARVGQSDLLVSAEVVHVYNSVRQ